MKRILIVEDDGLLNKTLDYITRRRELAILQSVGMTGRQLMKMLRSEGCFPCFF